MLKMLGRSVRYVAILYIAIFAIPSITNCFASDETPLTPIEARKHVGEQVVVQMMPATIKDRLERRGEVYFDSEKDFRDDKNFAFVITEKGANRFKELGIKEIAKHFEGHELCASGLVKLVDGVPRIEIDIPEQLKIVSKEKNNNSGAVAFGQEGGMR